MTEINPSSEDRISIQMARNEMSRYGVLELARNLENAVTLPTSFPQCISTARMHTALHISQGWVWYPHIASDWGFEPAKNGGGALFPQKQRAFFAASASDPIWNASPGQYPAKPLQPAPPFHSAPASRKHVQSRPPTKGLYSTFHSV